MDTGTQFPDIPMYWGQMENNSAAVQLFSSRESPTHKDRGLDEGIHATDAVT